MKIVIKVGTSVLTDGDSINKERMLNLVSLIVDLRKDNEVVLVSSGAVALGYTKKKLDKTILKNKQALAAIGQPLMAKIYDELFDIYGVHTAQVLVTDKNLSNGKEAHKFRDTIESLLEADIVPIVNENDATNTSELEVGDNDQLSAYITKGIDADLLVILSDIDAYYNCDPVKNSNAEVLSRVVVVSYEEIMRTSDQGIGFSTGGITTKLKAAKYLMDNDIPMFLGSGLDLEEVSSYLLIGNQIGGTLFSRQ